MEPVEIIYKYTLKDGESVVFNYQMDGETFDLISDDVAEPPTWTALDFNQCEHCPLNVDEHPHCPMALQLYNIIEKFHDTKSIDIVELEVIEEDRRVIEKTQIQRAIASMLELVFPSCGCPKTSHLKPLARFHQPMASEEETVFRVTGMYLLAQYFLSITNKTGRIEFDGLTEIYNDMHILNSTVATRLKTATSSDSTKNAITLVDMYSTLVPMLLEDQLAEMRGFFEAYLPADAISISTTNYLEKAKAFTLELEPIEGDTSGTPDWLKEAKGESPGKASFGAPEEEPDATQKIEVKKEEPIAPHIDTSGLSLAPIEGDTAKPTSGKASFGLAEEDEPPPSTPKPKKASFGVPDEEPGEGDKKSGKGDEEDEGGLKLVD